MMKQYQYEEILTKVKVENNQNWDWNGVLASGLEELRHEEISRVSPMP